MTPSLLNGRSSFSFVGTLRRQIALPAEGPNPLFRPLGASWTDSLYFGIKQNRLILQFFACIFGRCVFDFNFILPSFFMNFRDHQILIFCKKSHEIVTCYLSWPSCFLNFSGIDLFVVFPITSNLFGIPKGSQNLSFVNT